MKILFTHYFKGQLKRFKRKYPHLKKDLLDCLEDLDLKKSINIGRSIYKIRINSSDLNKGKSGGFRSYVYLYLKKDLLVPLCIYPKNQRESVTDNELQYYFDKAIEELLGS